MFGLTIVSSKQVAWMEREIEVLRGQLERSEAEKARMVDRLLESNGVQPISNEHIERAADIGEKAAKTAKGFLEMLAMETEVVTEKPDGK